MSLEQQTERYELFAEEVDGVAGFNPEYHARNYYIGPAVVVESWVDIQTVVRMTTMPLQWDPMGKTGYIVYPK